MNILLNAAPLTGLLTGISRYLRNLYIALNSFEDLQIDFFDGKRIYSCMPEQAQAEKWIKTTDTIWELPDFFVFGLRAVRWILYEHCLRARLPGKYDLYHETAFTPSAIGKSIPQVFTLHDLSLFHFRQYHPRERVWFSDFYFNKRIAEADQIIVPSEFIKNEACRCLQIQEKKISVIPEAADPFFYPRPHKKVAEIRKKMKIPESYLLFVGTLEPRKNLKILIEALRLCNLDVSLVLSGWQGWGDKEWMEKIKAYGLERRIVFTGYIDEESLACLYSGAKAFVYPSIYEGFGLPLLEAMACGCPVICSHAASLPEVAGNAALFFDPYSANQLAQKIINIYSDDLLSQTMIAKGYERSSLFSWESAAEKTRNVFCQMIKK